MHKKKKNSGCSRWKTEINFRRKGMVNNENRKRRSDVSHKFDGLSSTSVVVVFYDTF